MSNAKFKYLEIMDTPEVPCPPKNFEAREPIAFRWVFDAIEDEQNFVPQYFKNSARFQSSPPEVKCQSIGLSFFSSEQDARSRFEILTARMLKPVKDKIGKRIAVGTIYEVDGVSDLPDQKGHFTLHPFEAANFAGQFSVISDL